MSIQQRLSFALAVDGVTNLTLKAYSVFISKSRLQVEFVVSDMRVRLAARSILRVSLVDPVKNGLSMDRRFVSFPLNFHFYRVLLVSNPGLLLENEFDYLGGLGRIWTLKEVVVFVLSWLLFNSMS